MGGAFEAKLVCGGEIAGEDNFAVADRRIPVIKVQQRRTEVLRVYYVVHAAAARAANPLSWAAATAAAIAAGARARFD